MPFLCNLHKNAYNLYFPLMTFTNKKMSLQQPTDNVLQLQINQYVRLQFHTNSASSSVLAFVFRTTRTVENCGPQNELALFEVDYSRIASKAVGHNVERSGMRSEEYRNSCEQPRARQY